MKKIITLSLLITALMFSTTMVQALGLPLKLGIRGGANFSNFGGNASGDSDTRTGFLVGAVVKLNIPTTSFFLQSGVDYTIKGANININPPIGGSSTSATTIKTNPMYLQVPIHLGYKIGLPGIGFNISAGPYYAHGIGGKTKGGEAGSVDFFGDHGMKKSDFGVGAKVGAQLLGLLEVSAGYDFGLSNISRGDGKVKNKNAYVTVGYYFF